MLEIALTFALIALPYGSASVEAMNSDLLKMVLALLAGAAATYDLIWARLSRRPSELENPIIGLLAFYFVWMGCVSLLVEVAPVRWGMYLLLVTITYGFAVEETVKPGGFVRVFYVSAAFHVVAALLMGVRDPGSGRLTGGITPVSLGAEALLLIFLASALYMKRGRASHALVCLLALVVLVASFSRAAIGSALLAFSLIIFVLNPRIPNLFRAIAAVLAAYLFVTGVSGALGEVATALRTDEDALLSATGRTEIWQVLLSLNERWLLGYGFAAARYNNSGADEMLFIAAERRPPENALLEAVLSGGIPGGLLWLIIFLLTIGGLVAVLRLSRGLVIGWIVALCVNALLSLGLSGASWQIVWLYAAVSLPSLLRVEASAGACRVSEEQRSLAEQTRQSRLSAPPPMDHTYPARETLGWRRPSSSVKRAGCVASPRV